MLASVPLKSAPLATFITFDDAVLLNWVIPFTKFTIPLPVILAPESNVTLLSNSSIPNSTVPELFNTAVDVNVSPLNDAEPVLLIVPEYVVGSETIVPALSISTPIKEFLIFRTAPTLFSIFSESFAWANIASVIDNKESESTTKSFANVNVLPSVSVPLPKMAKSAF